MFAQILHMKNLVLGLTLFIIQLLLTFWGATVFGKYVSPYLFFTASLAIAGYTGWLLVQPKLTVEHPLVSAEVQPKKQWLGALLGIFSVALAYEEMRKLFVKFSPPREFSDVVPQIEALYNRFQHGEFPYAPVDMGSWSPYPVYMPLHWLPVGLAQVFGMDSRWAGFVLLALAAGIYGWFIMRTNRSLLQQIAVILLPSLALWAYIRFGGLDLPVSYELVIGAYYLVLATGLFARHLAWITAGLVLCLLSRYTLAFWLPLAAILFWQNLPRRQNFLIWGTVAVSVVLIYILPFYLKDPSILTKGLAYHNQAVVAEWVGYGDPPVSHSMERGIHFAIQLKEWFTGDMVERVHKARVLQGGLMLLVLLLGWLGWRRWRERLDYGTYALLLLYCFVLLFYCFGPLTYRYYLLVLHLLSAVLCGRIILQSELRRLAPA